MSENIHLLSERPLTDTSIGPAFAIPKVLTKAGITKDDVDFFEINEVSKSCTLLGINDPPRRPLHLKPSCRCSTSTFRSTRSTR